MHWFSIVLATLCVQAQNVWVIKRFAQDPGVGSALLLALLTLPIAFVANAAYAYYYGVGHHHTSYPMLAINAYGISLITTFAIHHLILKDRIITLLDMTAAGFVLCGLILMIFRQPLLDRLG